MPNSRNPTFSESPKKTYPRRPKESARPQSLDTIDYPTRSFDTIIYPESIQYVASETRGRAPEARIDHEKSSRRTSPYKSDREKDRRENSPRKRPSPYKIQLTRPDAPPLKIDTVKANKSGTIITSPKLPQLYPDYYMPDHRESRSSEKGMTFAKHPGQNVSNTTGDSEGQVLLSPASFKLLSPKEYPGNSLSHTFDVAGASKRRFPNHDASVVATAAENHSIPGEPSIELEPQTPTAHSFLDQVRDLAHSGCWTEQWEARKALATEIEWREDTKLLGTGTSMRKLLEMKVEERCCLSDALTYGLYVLSQTLATSFPRAPPQAPVRERVYSAGIKLEGLTDFNHSILSEPLIIPSSATKSPTPASDPNSPPTQQDILLALLSLESDSPVRRWAQKPVRSNSRPESSVEDRFLESLRQELLTRRNSSTL